MKLPAALNTMNIMGCEEGSEKGRVVSIIAVATSSFVTTVIVFCGMLFLTPIMTPLLTDPVIAPAFDNMFPALVGPMVIPVVLKNIKVAALPVALAIVLAVALGPVYSSIRSVLMVVVILLSLGVYRSAYKKRESMILFSAFMICEADLPGPAMDVMQLREDVFPWCEDWMALRSAILFEPHDRFPLGGIEARYRTQPWFL